MSRLLLLAALLFIGWWLWQRLRPTSRPRVPDDSGTITTVRCRQCGVHLPQSQAVQHHEQWYCCHAHAEQDDAGQR